MFENLTPNKGQEGLTKAARLFYIITGFAAIGLTMSLLSLLGDEPGGLSFFSLAHLLIAGALAFITAKGIESQRPWAKWLGYVQGFLLLLNVPIGTVIGIAVLIYINRAAKAGLFNPSPATSNSQ
jgi:hypothetical protein